MEKSQTKTEVDNKNENATEGLQPDTTTGSGISEIERRKLDGSSPQQPFDPDHPDFPGNDSRH